MLKCKLEISPYSLLGSQNFRDSLVFRLFFSNCPIGSNELISSSNTYVRLHEDVNQEKIEQHKAEQWTAGQVLAVLLQPKVVLFQGGLQIG